MKKLIVITFLISACVGDDNKNAVANNGRTSNNGTTNNDTNNDPKTTNTTPVETCGNRVLDSMEVCEGTDFGGKTCETEGFASGTLTCTNKCDLDVSECETCGNGVVDGDEDCDGDDLASATCATVIEGAGGEDLACNNECGFVTDSCLPPIRKCTDIDDCLSAACILGTSGMECAVDCYARAPAISAELHRAISVCINESMCRDRACLEEKCGHTTDACIEDGRIL